ncbi:hypothetical protein [Hahella ganghwensis]|uniref:hypothetical protein n=1 Tax=Hahella ganghwensis TaxID=286420 RepID=UPI00035D25AB|nr:hypothetical protein [Hahella ganghwensis]
MPKLTGTGPDFSNLQRKECGIGSYRLTFRLPGNPYMQNRPEENLPTQVNLRSDLFDSGCTHTFNRTHITIGFGWWAYKGFILQGNKGQLCDLCLHIDVNKVEGDATLQKGDLISLETYLKDDLDKYYEAEGGVNWKTRQRSQSSNIIRQGETPAQFLALLPERYEKDRINGIDWLSYHFGSEGGGMFRRSDYWAYPLDANYYLTVRFKLTFEAGDRESRLQRMLQDARRIMSMVELHS